MTTTNSWNNIVPNNDVTFQRTDSGTPQVDLSTHTSNTAGSDAKKRILVAGASGGDPFVEAAVNGVRAYNWGIDTSATNQPLLEVTAAASSTTPSTGTILRQMSSGGAQRLPLQPAFSVDLVASVLNVTGDNTSYGVVFDTVNFDTRSGYSVGTGFYTVPADGAGLWYLFATISYDGITALHNETFTSVACSSVNATVNSIAGSLFPIYNTVFGAVSVTVGGFFQVNAGAILNVNVRIAGSTKTISILGSGASVPQRFTTMGGWLVC